jgi:energy-coupling factor transport system ATP-binding protein
MSVSVSIEDLTFTYRGADRPALRDIRGVIDGGSFVVVMGHGGAGKSTLCVALNGLVPRFFRGTYQGRVLVKGRETGRSTVAQMSRVAGLVLQEFEAQLFSTNVELEMAFGPENHGLPRPEIGRRIDRYLSLVGLEGLRRREPATLSGGQKQRLAIGSVMALEPDVLVMDEPATDLDPRGRQEILAVTAELRQLGRTLVVADHEPETAQGADQVWLLREGEMAAQGPPGEILRETSLLRSCGVRVPPLLELFASLGWPGRPLTVEEAIGLIRDHGLAVPRQRRFSLAPSASGGRPILQAKNLAYAYPGPSVEALRGINLSIQDGEFIALLGQNGSGKTTLAKHFNGLLRPDSGTMLLDGKSTGVYSHREIARKVGYVFQNPDHQIFSNTVFEEVGFGLKVLGEAPSTIRQRVSEALEVVGLQGYEARVPFALTKGERQRVAVASVLAVRPRVIVLDEPTTGLDFRHCVDMMEMLRSLNRRGHTVIIITHSMDVASEYADRTVVMGEGQILLDGPTRAVFADEEKLAGASLRPPSLARLSNWLGARGLTVPALVAELKP